MAPEAPAPAAAHHDVKWTQEQRAGISTTGTGLLLSAAAGSGKTAVLAERCAHLVCDATPPCSVDELLVVTFTRAAAGEMRTRIEQALRKRLDQSDDPRLHQQIALLERAQISTLHSFCTTVLRRHFNVLGIDPGFRLLDEEEGKLLRLQTIRDVLGRHYESEKAGDFEHFIDTFGDGHDETLVKRLLHLHALLESLVDPHAWLDTALDRLREAAEKPLSRSELGGGFIRLLDERLAALLDECDTIDRLIAQYPGCMPYASTVSDIRALVDRLRGKLASGDIDGLASVLDDNPVSKLSSVKNDTPGQQRVKQAIDALREPLKKGDLLAWCRASGSQWIEGMKATLPAANMLADLVREFNQAYRQAKEELRALDYADLERLTLRVLRDPDQPSRLHPSRAAREYHQQIRHVLVDEYQDINELQSAILNLISTECLADGRTPSNLFCVGDVKQSIYRFRLADPGRFIERYKQFKSGQAPGKVIDLRSNFRSRGALLDVLNGIFRRLMTEQAAEIAYDDSHQFVAGAAYPPAEEGSFTGAPIELHLIEPPPRGQSGGDDSADDGAGDLDRIDREAALIADRIRTLMGEGQPRRKVADRTPSGLGYRPIEYRDIAILLRATQNKASAVAEVLRSAGIPVHNDSGGGFFESVEIRDMLALLALLDNQQQDIPLAAFLRGPLAALDQADDSLARIAIAYPKLPFHRAVTRYAANHTDDLAHRLRSRLEQLAAWRTLANRNPVADVLWTICEQTGYLAFCAGLNDGRQRVANLIRLHELARQFGTFQRQGLRRFREFLDSLQAETDMALPSIASEAENVVRILSVHRSKGLEFPVVILPDLGKAHNFESSAGTILVDRARGLGLMVPDEDRRIIYPSLASIMVGEQIRRQTLAEELRVLYVAMTRAREHLILIGSVKLDADEAWRQQWSGHNGPLPPAHVLAGRCMYDWIGPAAAAINASQDAFEIIKHDDAAIRSLAQGIQVQPPRTRTQEQLIALQPLNPPPAPDPQANEVIARLTTPYAHAPLTRLRAARSVTELTKHDKPAPAGHSPAIRPLAEMAAPLPAPSFLDTSLDISPTDLGTATHRVLQQLDFARPCTGDDLARQIAQLVERKMLAPRFADKLDLEAIEWLIATPLGAMMRQAAGRLMRELPIRFALEPGAFDSSLVAADPHDRVMVRGVIDVLIPRDDGLVLVDYKTDRVTAQTLDARADFYRPQLISYRDAIVAITCRPVVESWLAFLAARELRRV